jgi:hypothetical protein
MTSSTSLFCILLVFNIPFTTGHLSTAATYHEGGSYSTGGHEGGETSILITLQEDIKNLKMEQASTLHQLSSTLNHRACLLLCLKSPIYSANRMLFGGSYRKNKIIV